MIKHKKYQDFLIQPVKDRRAGIRTGRYYSTRLKRLPGGKVEVTLNLPPKIIQQMQFAIKSGKQIRVLVP